MRKGTSFRSSERATQLRELARQLLDQHGLTDWEFGINSNVRRAGVCFYPHSGNPGRIEISAHFAERNSDEEFRDTLLHEIAHALVGPRHGHDAVWQSKCVEIGARPQRCYGSEVEMPKGRWRAVCPTCSKEYDRHRRPRQQTGWYCRPCGSKHGTLTWTECLP
jgi:predicted SprT family Zn-dependent metalloprotease